MATEPGSDGKHPAPEGGAAGAAFLEGIARRYRAALNRFFERRITSGGGDSEDMTQEVFVRLARRDSREGAIDNVEGYLFQTASSVLTDRIRKRAVRHAADHVAYSDSDHAVEDFSPERVLIGRDRVERVIRALDELPPQVRAAFVLHRLEGLKYHEIARRLGVSVSAVEKYIMRALRHVAALTKENE